MRAIAKIVLPSLSALTNADSNDCYSACPRFTLEPINLSSYYTHTTASASGPKASYISFQLQRDGTNFTAACSSVISMPLAQFHGFRILEWAMQGGGKSPFSFESYTGLIHVNSTWICSW